MCLFVFAVMINCTSKTDCFCFHGNTRRGREWDFFFHLISLSPGCSYALL